MASDAVVVPGCVTLRRETLRRLSAFAAEGGKVVFLGEAPTHVDAVPSEEPQRLRTQIGFDRSLLLRELEPWRLVDLKDENGVRTNEYLSQLRKTEEGYLLFLANGRAIHGEDVPEARKLTVELPAEYKLTLLDTLTGRGVLFRRSIMVAERFCSGSFMDRTACFCSWNRAEIRRDRHRSNGPRTGFSALSWEGIPAGRAKRPVAGPSGICGGRRESFQPCEELLRAIRRSGSGWDIRRTAEMWPSPGPWRRSLMSIR